LAACLVFFMQAGFALLETGMVRAKNVTHTMAMNVVVFCGGALGFWLCGYAVQNGFRPELFCLTGRGLPPAELALFFFFLMYMDTAATIPTGAMAERWRFLPFVFFGLFMSMILFPVYAQWVWDHDHGWLAQLGRSIGLGHGVVDFAGSAVVHMVGGGAALVGAYLIGPRRGKFRLDGRPNPLPAHNVPMYMTGTLILTFGWFGFNGGGAALLSDEPVAAALASRVLVNTVLAAAAGAFAAMTYTWTLYKKPDASFLCNGALAGLVASTAGCAYVPPAAAVLIGAVAGMIVIGSVLFVERKLKIDDPVGAISVHGVSGAWGLLAVGLFADGSFGEGLNGVAPPVKGLLFGDAGQFAAQLIGAVVCLLWVLPVTFAFLLLVRRCIGLRVIAVVEEQGLDVPELGTVGYHEEDAKFNESRYRYVDPRPASVPPNLGKAFTIRVQGIDLELMRKIWSDHCQIGNRQPTAEFKAVYPYMTTVRDNQFRFRGGDPETVRVSLERLFKEGAWGSPVTARVDDI
ncbi:MAG TPA: ammonium transporter, partial [Gemmataceae bacterium]|nr:ammonium transporter [Gemmataceae bacterium]